MVFVNKYRHNSICGICKQGQTCKIWGICKQVQIWLDLKTSRDLLGLGAFDGNLGSVKNAQTAQTLANPRKLAQTH